MNSLVPSSGSMIQTRSASSRSAESAVSSDRIASSGKAARSISQMIRLAARSAWVTGLSSALFQLSRSLPA
jgi:hypothetical protein